MLGLSFLEEKENTLSPRTREKVVSAKEYELLRAEPRAIIAQAERKEGSKYGAEGRSGCRRKLEPLYSSELIRLVSVGKVGHAQDAQGCGKKRRMSSDRKGCGSIVG